MGDTVTNKIGTLDCWALARPVIYKNTYYQQGCAGACWEGVERKGGSLFLQAIITNSSVMEESLMY